MPLKRFALLLCLLLVAQAGVFAYWYRDLLHLRQPAATLATTPDVFETAAARALTRTSLTRRHLETIADGARRLEHAQTEQAALSRLVEQYPADPVLRLRYAESLRLSGRLADAEKHYAAVLEGTTGAGAR